MRQGNSW